MQRIKLPLTDILVEDRQRKDYGDIEELAQSIARLGLIQPIVIDQNKRLIAGGRRLEAHIHLKRETIDVVYRETLHKDELYELELEENIQRKDMTWQERTLNIIKVHELKSVRAQKEATEWGYRQTGAMLGISLGKVQYTLQVGYELKRDPDGPVAKADNFTDALRILLQRAEDRVAAEMVRRTSPTAQVVETIVRTPVAVAASSTEPNLAAFDFPLAENPDAQVVQEVQTEIVIPLSKSIVCVDCIRYMMLNPGQVDHIVTDPPYGIDVEMMQQQNTHGGMNDVERIAETHNVEMNEIMFSRMFNGFYSWLKEDGYLVLWCDIMQWQRLYDHAINAGFKVQRWPLTWVKMHPCMNNSAQFNFTKNTEIAMVCRKGKATMVSPSPTSVVIAANDADMKKLGHPFVKPRTVWDFILRHISIEGQVIGEPFAGVGSGVLAMLQSNRQVVACELDEKHYNNLVENVKTHYKTIAKNVRFT